MRAELKAEFWETLSAKLGVSVNTEFNWKDVSIQTKQSTKITNTEVPVPPGKWSFSIF